MNKFFIYFFSILLLLTIDVSAYNLNKILLNVTETNHKILAGQKHVQSISEDLNISSVTYKPILTLNSSVGHKQTRTPSLSKYSPSNVDLNMKQILFDGYKGRYSNQRAKEDLYKAEFEQILLVQSVFLEVINVYIDLLRYDELLNLNIENKDLLIEELSSFQMIFSLGDIKKSDVLLVEANYEKTLFDIAKIEKNIFNLSIEFENLTQMKPVNLTTPNIKIDSFPLSLNEALLIASSEHPSIRLNQHVINSANLNTKIIESERCPKFDLNAKYSKGWNPSSILRPSDTLSVVGTITIRLYDSGLVNSKLRKSSLLVNKSALVLEVSSEDGDPTAESFVASHS